MQLRILVDALAGLHHAHELCDFDGKPLQVVHRDVTPHNIFLTYAGQVKVVDFGIAKALSSSSETRTGVLKGKVAYMAPEQAMGERVDRRADVFSAGMILWEVLAGKRPFKGVPDVAILQKLVNGGIVSPTTVKEDIPAELERICMKALAHDRDERYATAADMGADLEKAIEDFSASGAACATPASSPSSSSPATGPRSSSSSRRTPARTTPSPTCRPGIPRMSSSGPKLPVFDDHMTHEGGRSSVREGGSGLREHGSAPRSGSFKNADGPTHEPSHPTTLTAATASSPLTVSPQPQARGRLVATLAAGVVGAAAAVAIFTTRGRTAAAPTPPPPAPSATAAAPRVHTIMIDSMPQGATIREGDKELGKTPMTLDLDLTSSTQRRLVMSLEGYTSHTFIPTRDDVRIQVPLSAIPAAPAPEKAAEKTADKPAVARVVPRAPAPPPAAPARPAVPSDINMAR